MLGEDLLDLIEVVFLATDVMATVFFYTWFSWLSRLEQKINNAPYFTSNRKLKQALKYTKDDILDYAGIQGVLTELETPPDGINNTGRYQEMYLTIQGKKRKPGYWYIKQEFGNDMLELMGTHEKISNILQFGLHPAYKKSSLKNSSLKNNKLLLYLMRPFNAIIRLSINNFTLVHSIDAIHSRKLACQLQIRIPETLKVGTTLLGIGKIVLYDNELFLLPPKNSHGMYILTSFTKEELIQHLNMQIAIFKCLAVLFGISCFSVIAHSLYRQYWKTSDDDDDDITEVFEDLDHDNCVVCFVNPREFVLLECGHRCLCGACLDRLGPAILCPVCEEEIVDVVRAYMP